MLTTYCSYYGERYPELPEHPNSCQDDTISIQTNSRLRDRENDIFRDKYFT